MSVCEEAIALVSPWRLHAYQPADGIATWHKQDDPEVVNLQDIMSSLVCGECQLLNCCVCMDPIVFYANDNCLGCTHDEHIVHKTEQYMQINMANGNVE